MEDNFQDFFKETKSLAKNYAEKRLELAKLQATLKTSKGLALFFTLLMLFFSLLFILIFFGMSFSFWMAEKTGSTAMGFGITAIILTFVLLILVIFRRPLLMEPMANILVREISKAGEDAE